MKTGILLFTYYLFASSSLETCNQDGVSRLRKDTCGDIIHFNASYINTDGVKLDWQTASDISSGYFEVQRSADAICFEKARVVKGSGNSQQSVSYSVFDEHPLPGFSYYRLKQVNRDGRYFYSQITGVNYSGQEGIGATAFNKGTIFVQVLVPENTAVEIQLLNIAGGMLKHFKHMLECGSNEVKIKADDVPPGIYFIKVSMSGQEYYKKVYVLSE